jgi:hypothetical protein
MFDHRNFICVMGSLELSGVGCTCSLCHDGISHTIKGDVSHLHAIVVNLGNCVPLLRDGF